MLASQILTTLATVYSLVAAAPASIHIREDDVILYGSGRFTIMPRDKLSDELSALRKNHTMPPMPSFLNNTLFHGNGTQTKPKPSAKPIPSAKPSPKPKGARDLGFQKRDGDTLIITNPVETFLGWDVLMSAVVKGAPTTIAVTAGYSIANSVSVSQSVDFDLVKDFLSTSLSIDYGTTWTTTQTQAFTASVPADKYGAFVSNPWTTRNSGNVFQGTIGSQGSLTYYQADSFSAKGYSNLDWVDGVISLCTGDTFPLPRCLGGGTL